MGMDAAGLRVPLEIYTKLEFAARLIKTMVFELQAASGPIKTMVFHAYNSFLL